MSSETRTIRPYQGVDQFQLVLDECHLRVGDREIAGGSRVSLALDEYLNYPVGVQLAEDEHELHENQGRIADGLGDLGLATSDVELVILAIAPRLKLVDVIYARRLDEIPVVPNQIAFPTDRPRALRAPVGGCDVRVFFCLARQFPPRALRPWRKGTWLAKQEFQLRSDLGGVGFLPVRLTDDERTRLELDSNATRHVEIDDGHSVFQTEVPPDAVRLYVDEGLLDRLAIVAHSAVGKQLQRQLFLDAASAVVRQATVETFAGDVSEHSDVDEFAGSLVHGLVEMLAGRGSDDASARGRNEAFRQLLHEPERFLSNLEARLASRRDVLEIFED